MIGRINHHSTQDVAASKTQQSKQTTKLSSSAPPVIPKALAATGLPQDKLSASVLSFARFFSLPLKPQLLADIRRQALMPQLQSNTTQHNASAGSYAGSSASTTAANTPVPGETAQLQKSFTEVKTREAFTLAAAAAESKGVELQQKGLEAYAEAVDPDRRRQNDEDRQREKRDKNQNEEENIITAENMKKMALQNSENNSLLEILNNLPGKNGQRWIVLPFEFCEGDREYFVTMRIMLEEEPHIKTLRAQRHKGNYFNHVSYMVLDVVSDFIEYKIEGNKERKIFIIESANDKPVKLSIYFQPELQSKDKPKVKNELSQAFGISPDQIHIKSSEENFPFESGFGDKISSVDEAV